MNSIQFSIVIPTYNRADLVVRTINSVLDQSFTDYEIIVIDDGSTDHTKDALQDFNSIPNFRYVFQENHGRSTARNAGMEIATGRYLMFLDSDDILEPDALELLSAAAKRHGGSGLIAGRRRFINVSGELLHMNDPVKGYREIMAENIFVESIIDVFFPPSAYVVTKTLARELGGYKTEMEPAEDFDFFIRCCDVAKVSAINSSILRMRRHDGNTADFQLRKATIKIARQNLARLDANAVPYKTATLKRMRALWLLRMGDDHYSIEEDKDAFRCYCRSILEDHKILASKYGRHLAATDPGGVDARVDEAADKSFFSGGPSLKWGSALFASRRNKKDV